MLLIKYTHTIITIAISFLKYTHTIITIAISFLKYTHTIITIAISFLKSILVGIDTNIGIWKIISLVTAG